MFSIFHSHGPNSKSAHLSVSGVIKDFFELYMPNYRPNTNIDNLNSYYGTKEWKKHAESARVYYNAFEMTSKDAMTVASHREPTNLQNLQEYKKTKLKQKYGYEESPYNDKSLRKEDHTSFADLPNTVCIYSETFMWRNPGKEKKFEIGLLNVPAPALDSMMQPNHKYYIDSNGDLILNRYRAEMDFLAKVVVQTVLDHKDTAFEGRGLKSLVLNDYGQGWFLSCVKPDQKKDANLAFFNSLVDELGKHVKQLSDFPIVMAETHDQKNTSFTENFVGPLRKLGFKHVSIRTNSFQFLTDERELLVNAWDPHSMVGNGNNGDQSWDGKVGSLTGGVLTCTPQLNSELNSEKPYIGIK